ncbi:DUF493 domain-containing protein [Campylobacter sp. MIT 21-1685]|uniref:HP0495 family protein n=1 Tax=unclassified Campylobacter TaxID=2593542 RepID=UPI00224B49E5|nr:MULTISPECIES: DUF493 domain-containing protein [unclassified Campylobacter]MCX2683066.1 DUF493 domain-containing protein [Campylobacter sp. MIT 21-1684]MCX2751348.1 DUF493 domain-containing protein [Campylobacter sp. MIT 21-1682]MCX2807547.1 DUF493 domain-containing protein [Campylobacter sp. MIT 21-1685]
MVHLCELNKEALISYPLFWEYKVILATNKDVQQCFKKLLKEKEFTFEHSHTSKNGRYESYKLSVFVHNKEERLEIFEKLKTHSQFVL